jgi:ketosteroid isomerase-like protein
VRKQVQALNRSSNTRWSKFIPHGERVVVPMTARMTGRGGIKVEANIASMVTLRDGRVVRWTMYQDRAEALKAVGLEE